MRKNMIRESIILFTSHLLSLQYNSKEKGIVVREKYIVNLVLLISLPFFLLFPNAFHIIKENFIMRRSVGKGELI